MTTWMQPSAERLGPSRHASHDPPRVAGPQQVASDRMEFRRITNLPPYVFTIINSLKIEARRAGADVIDLGFGNPDIPSPQIAVEKLAEAAHNARNHRYSRQPRPAQAARGRRRAATSATGASQLDPELEITNTIGSKEGFSHLMWVLLDRGDAAIVPSPSYPIHIYGPLFAGADLRQVPMRTSPTRACERLRRATSSTACTTAYDVGWPKPRVLVISFPHNPTGAVRRPRRSCSGSSTSAASGR